MDESNDLLGRVGLHTGFQSEGFKRQWNAIWTIGKTRQSLDVDGSQGWESQQSFRSEVFK